MALTDTKLRNLKASGERVEFPDRDGLVLRVSQKGRMTWTVMYRVHGQSKDQSLDGVRLAGAKQRLTLGEYPTLGLSAAREKAAAIRRMARGGSEPDKTFRLRQPAGTSVSDLIDKYVTGHLNRNLKSGANVEKLLRLEASRLENLVE